MSLRRLVTIALVAAAAGLAAVAADSGRADACPGCITGSLYVHVPPFEPGRLQDPRPPTESDFARYDAEASTDRLPAPAVCAKLAGEHGGIQPNGPIDQELRKYPPASTARDPSLAGDVDLTTVYGQVLVRARILALNCEPTLTVKAIAACVRWGVRTDGVVHASPFTAVVNTRSLFWLDGMLAQTSEAWLLGAHDPVYTDGKCDSANDGAACIWNDVTSRANEGVWLIDGQLTYERSGTIYSVDCNTIGGILDPNNPTGRATETTVEQYFGGDPHAPVDTGVRYSARSANPEYPEEDAAAMARDGVTTWDLYGDANGNQQMDVDPLGRGGVHNPDEYVQGTITVIRHIDPEALGAYIYLAFGPWEWGYGGGADPDERAYGSVVATPADPPRGTGPGWDPLADFIANTPGIDARGDDLDAVPGGRAAVSAAICDPAHSSCATGYAGPAHVYDSHGLQPLRVTVDRSMEAEITHDATELTDQIGKSSNITFAIDDVYGWVERWPHSLVGERTEWSALASAGGSTDCTETANANEEIGSTCDTVRYKTDWAPSLSSADGADAGLAGAQYSYYATSTACSPGSATLPASADEPESKITFGGETATCSCSATAIYEEEEVCTEPPEPLVCGPQQVHKRNEWSCTGSLTVTLTASLSASQCSGRNFDAATTGAYDPDATNPHGVAPTARNVVEGLTSGLGANDSLLGKSCGWKRTSLSWEHLHHAYWSCQADALNPVEWSHAWYIPALDATDARTSGPNGETNPPQPANGAECRVQHDVVFTPSPITVAIPAQDLPAQEVNYSCQRAQADAGGDPAMCPAICGLTGVGPTHGYPVIRREPILARAETRVTGLDPVGCPAGTPVGDGVTEPVTPPAPVGTAPPPDSPNVAPEFEVGVRTFYIDENSIWPDAVEDADGNTGLLIATDDDGDPLVYEMGACSSDFYVDRGDGTIRARYAADLDFETLPNVVSCVVRVSDPDFAFDTTRITIHTRDAQEPQDNAPVFSPASFTFSIGELARPGDIAGTVTATDADLAVTPSIGERLTYALARRGTDLVSNHFSINPATGAVFVRTGAALGAATKSSYALAVTVTDAGGNTASANVDITVTAETPTVAAPTNVTFSRTQSYEVFPDPNRIHHHHDVQWRAPPGGGARKYDLARKSADGSGEWVAAKTSYYLTTATNLREQWKTYTWWNEPAPPAWLEVRVRVANTAGAAWSAPVRCTGGGRVLTAPAQSAGQGSCRE